MKAVVVGPNVIGLAPRDYVVPTERCPGRSIYDGIGSFDMATVAVCFERRINLPRIFRRVCIEP